MEFFQEQPSLAGIMQPGDGTRYEFVAVKTFDTVEVVVRNDDFFDKIVFLHGAEKPYYTIMLRLSDGKRDTNPFTIKAAALIKNMLLDRITKHEAEATWLRHLLRLIINDLPTKKDWLDPGVEAEARKAIREGA
jgi:hypothetical protein